MSFYKTKELGNASKSIVSYALSLPTHTPFQFPPNTSCPFGKFSNQVSITYLNSSREVKSSSDEFSYNSLVFISKLMSLLHCLLLYQFYFIYDKMGQAKDANSLNYNNPPESTLILCSSAITIVYYRLSQKRKLKHILRNKTLQWL